MKMVLTRIFVDDRASELSDANRAKIQRRRSLLEPLQFS